ncbi:MAG: hypothetical protein J7L23_02765 [Candidatus Diapherotrites archaeon]|nr:hypothetical protein [Candidatus Diapherotrites archaeon]
MANYPKEVIAETDKGPEVRTLVSRGRYVLCDYREPGTMRPISGKKKLILINENGKQQEYFIIPLKQPGKSLLIEPAKKFGRTLVWNMKVGRAEEI